MLTEPQYHNSNVSSCQQAVILAAGRGMRAYPATQYIPKALLDIAGKTLIERNIEILVNQLGIQNIIIVVGHYGDQIIEKIGYSYANTNISYVMQSQQKGIGHALMCVEEHITSQHFVVMLADELYLHSNHHDFLLLLKQYPDMDGAVMLRHEDQRKKISNNYTAKVVKGRIQALIEKPQKPETDIMGVGSYLLNRKVFEYIRKTPASPLRNEIEITDVLSHLAKHEDIHAVMGSGVYLNINTVDDRNLANYIIKDSQFEHCKVSVVIPAYNEEETIVSVVKEFLKLKNVHEVVVVNNNSKDRTAELAAFSGARVVHEMKPGYGCALRRGLDEASGDIVVLTEADSSFSPNDLPKLLEYLKDCDMVIGTRTTRQMIEQGANMGTLARIVNAIFGKLIEVLWWSVEPRFTDVGCTYRAIWKSSYEKARPYIDSKGPEFAPDMMIALLICKLRVIEIPVTYRQRAGGNSKHSSNFLQLSITALKMLKLIIKRRITYSPYGSQLREAQGVKSLPPVKKYINNN